MADQHAFRIRHRDYLDTRSNTTHRHLYETIGGGSSVYQFTIRGKDRHRLFTLRKTDNSKAVTNQVHSNLNFIAMVGYQSGNAVSVCPFLSIIFRR
jgi:hypothetical protein